MWPIAGGGIDLPPPAAPIFRTIKPTNPHLALGMAVEFLMVDPAFGKLGFGHWSRVLAGQINRGHFMFVAEGGRIVAFAGWALATRANAEAWLSNRRDLSYADSLAGEVVVLNAWKATTTAAHHYLVAALRPKMRSRTAIYAKRVRRDGKVRLVRLAFDHSKSQFSGDAAGEILRTAINATLE